MAEPSTLQEPFTPLLTLYRPSVTSSYEDLDVLGEESRDVVELKAAPLPPSTPDKETALLGRRVPRRLVRQASIMETPLDSSGSMKMTYWF